MKKNISIFLEKFRRITSAESYMPEIDGLRFVAVFWVVFWMHTTNFVNVKFFNQELFPPYVVGTILEGTHGVSLFFMISGFILGLPFARHFILGEKKVSLKNYYLRRITRLEPPYLAALLIAFSGLVFIKKESFTELLPHLGASAIYCHNLIYGTKSTILGIAWSLEVEVRFYLLAPFMAYLYKIKGKALRYLIFITLIIIFTSIGFTSLYQKLPMFIPSLGWFLTGMLLCDFYLNKIPLPGKSIYWFVAGLLIFIFSPFLLTLYIFIPFLMKMALLAVFFYVGITNERMKKLLSIQWVTIIGGMCYSIYLLQFIIMSGSNPLLLKIKFSHPAVAFFAYSFSIVVFVLAGSMIFYKLIEQPCMRKNWYKKFLRHSLSGK
ncbi:MAG: acyltransferase [Bacteroidota bacterium]